jgi:prophage regulatory protein
MERLRRIIRKKDVYAYCGLKRTALEEEIAAGRFPKPISLTPGGRAKAFYEDEIIEWQKRRLTARDGGENG